MKRREFLTAALVAPAALAGSSALATSDNPKCSDFLTVDAAPEYEMHAVLQFSADPSWEPTNCADYSAPLIEDCEGHDAGFFESESAASADEYCRDHNARVMVLWSKHGRGSESRYFRWSVPIVIRFCRPLSEDEPCLVILVSRKPQRDRVIEVFGPVCETAADQIACGFNGTNYMYSPTGYGDERKDEAFAVYAEFNDGDLEWESIRRFQVLTMNPLNGSAPTVELETESAEEAFDRANYLNGLEMARQAGRWAIVRTVDCGTKVGAA